ncbi:u3 small nucleolar ribonucleoprotein MPP10 [Kappamyces sp. JEL0680]|nr:u3 small nucleolar ribonucleoprotein MPP10 [Kappamyces sp. JEL0680]
MDLQEYQEELGLEGLEGLESLDEDSDTNLDKDSNLAQPKRKPKKSIVDDDFFSLEEMERFADMAEARDIKMANQLSKNTQEEDESEDENDMFSIGKDIKYEDFFVAKPTKNGPRKSWKSDMSELVRGDEDDEEGEDEDMLGDNVDKEDEDGQSDEQAGEEKTTDLFGDDSAEQQPNRLSSFEKEQLKMQENIKKLESENMAEKEWVMRGEVSSKSRPVNSLLEQDLDVDIAAKPVPVITEETTKTLADLIIQRIKDQAFDDVVRKAPPKDTVYDPNRRWELDDEKSKKSLAEIYEEEYQKKAMSAEVKSAKTIALEKEHEEISHLVTLLVQDLDALSNWHYTPKPATLELSIVPSASVPAISLEEVIPAHVSSAKLANPKEVYDGKVAKAQTELDSAEKSRLRVKAKRKASSERKEREKAKKLRSAPGEMQHEITKSTAIKKLMGQKNVTLVVDSKNKKQLGSGMASTVEKGGKIGKEKKLLRPEMLKL